MRQMSAKRKVRSGKPGRQKGSKNRFKGVVAAAKALGVHYTYFERILKGETPDPSGLRASYRRMKKSQTAAGAASSLGSASAKHGTTASASNAMTRP